MMLTYCYLSTIGNEQGLQFLHDVIMLWEKRLQSIAS